MTGLNCRVVLHPGAQSNPLRSTREASRVAAACYPTPLAGSQGGCCLHVPFDVVGLGYQLKQQPAFLSGAKLEYAYLSVP